MRGAHGSSGLQQRDVELTERQCQVLRLIAAGKTNAEIGTALGISLDGAKWHVSEILAKLDVSTREEAAEWWKQRERPVAKAGRILRVLLTPGAWKLAGTAAAICAGGGVALALVWLAADDRDATEASSPTTPPVSAGAAVTSIPGSTPADGPIAFKLCTLAGGWSKPTGSAKAVIFADRRFGDGTRPDPSGWAVYLSRFYGLFDPRSRSANKTLFAFNSIEDGPPPNADQFCDPAGLANTDYRAVWLIDHRLVGLQSKSGQLVAEVEPQIATLQQIIYPYPPVGLSGQSAPVPQFQSFLVITADGRLLHRQGSAGTVEFGDDGQFRFGELRADGPLAIVLDTPLNADLFSTSLSAAATLIVRDTRGQVVSRIDLAAASTVWTAVATMHLEPGSWTIELDGAALRDHGFILLPSGSPHP